jgi:hypothetical protein
MRENGATMANAMLDASTVRADVRDPKLAWNADVLLRACFKTSSDAPDDQRGPKEIGVGRRECWRTRPHVWRRSRVLKQALSHARTPEPATR